MSSEQQEIPVEILDDLCSRFIINIPLEQRDDTVRVLFAVELAHWFYIDCYCTDGDRLPAFPIKPFAQQIFQHCPFLRDKILDLDISLTRWRDYKYSVPTYGAVLIDSSYEYILLVHGYYHRESWGFPKGKVQENESPLKCAIREVMEEVGFDMKDRALEHQYLERELNGQIIRLYIIDQVPKDTKFVPKTKGEIKEVRWFRIADLPSHRHDTTPQMNLNLTAKAFFMVMPFVKDLNRWINSKLKNVNDCPRTRHRAYTTHPIVMEKQSTPILQKQLSIQDTIQRHFSQILKNDSMTVTDQTSVTETWMKQENSPTSHSIRLTPPISTKTSSDHRHRCRTDSGKREEFVCNDTFSYNGPRCWTQFRLNRSEVFRCLCE